MLSLFTSSRVWCQSHGRRFRNQLHAALGPLQSAGHGLRGRERSLVEPGLRKYYLVQEAHKHGDFLWLPIQ